MNEKNHFDVPGINLLKPWLIDDLKNVDPRSLFLWVTKEKGFTSERYVSRGEYIKLLILRIQKSK